MNNRLLLPIICLSFSLLFIGCGEDEVAEDSRRGRPAASIPSVEIVQAKRGALPLEERLVGIVKADNQVVIYPEITAPITRVLAQNGDFVEQGQILAYLESRQFEEQLNQAKANLRINEANARQAEAQLRQLTLQFERTVALADKQLVSELELETERAQVDGATANLERTRAQVEQARATVEEREANLARTAIRAPISGRIGQRNAEIGMRVNGNTELFTIGDLDNVRIEASLTERMLSYIEEGHRARISSESIGDSAIYAPLSRISPFLEQSSFSTTAEIDVSNAGGLLKPGMFVSVDVYYGESQQSAVVPNSALYEDPSSGAIGVYVATSLGLETMPILPEEDDGQAPYSEPTPMEFREVEVIARGHDLTGVAGIDDNAWVVTVGQQLLRGDNPQARTRATTWNRLIVMQNLQREDLLKQFLDKQQRLARSGAIMGNQDTKVTESGLGKAEVADESGDTPPVTALPVLSKTGGG